MANTAHAVDADALARARDLLDRPSRRERMWPALAAAGALAASALAFAAAMITAPPVTSQHPVHERSVD
jgi:hypothetical protein